MGFRPWLLKAATSWLRRIAAAPPPRGPDGSLLRRFIIPQDHHSAGLSFRIPNSGGRREALDVVI